MPFRSIIFDILFLVSVSVIWVMILYQLILTFFGSMYRQLTERTIPVIDEKVIEQLPCVSILVPARNEEVVIQRTIRRLLLVDYPKHKLEIVVINDGSTDNTRMIVDQLAAEDKRIVPVHLPEAAQGHGKAYALNIGLQKASHSYIGIYDADNRPEPDALIHLVHALQNDQHLGAVIGKFRTQNKSRNILTRFINIETLSFQWILQAGRYHAFRIAILPGTNCVIRKDVLTECGGWDEKAITEDSELSVRIYRKGWKIRFVPYAVTWEQEPETLSVWTRQRTRWVRGNNYVIRKFLSQALLLKNHMLSMEFLYLFILYYLFLGAIVISHLLFILCGMGILSVTVSGPYTAVWISAYFMYLLEIILVLSYEDEDSILNILVTAIMYFTYCQLWIYVVFKGLILDAIRKNVGVWDKTIRVEEDLLAGEKSS
jgi:cellulose synthase/poly-beta-1,6-N-acetylglucosamine synthase-like glycosyltransferase